VDPKAILARFAPVAGEEARRAFICDALRLKGLAPRVDEVGNVLAGEGPVWFAAHYDTVLPPRAIEEREGRWYAPAIGDNSSGVAVLLALAEPGGGAGYVFTVGEEGLGNLKGARAFLRSVRPEAFVAVDGYLGTIVPWAVGSERLEVVFRGPGGHAWGDRGRPSASRALGIAIARLYDLDLPEDASLNVGRVWGGGAINAIPAEAGFWLDLRATRSEALAHLVEEARRVVAEAARLAGVEAGIQPLGSRPAGRTASERLLRAAREAVREAGLPIQERAASTDAAAAVPYGVPAIAVGAYRGGGAHTEEEWVEPDSLALGLRVLSGLLVRLR